MGGDTQDFERKNSGFWAGRPGVPDIKIQDFGWKNQRFWVGNPGFWIGKPRIFWGWGGFEKTDGAARKLIFRRFPQGRPKSGHPAIEKTKKLKIKKN